MENRTINVEDIMEEIRRETQEKIFDEILDFEEIDNLGDTYFGFWEKFDMGALLAEISVVNQTYPLPSIEVDGRFKLFKKILRKAANFITKQFVSNRNEYNTHIVKALNQIRNYFFSMEKTDAEQQKIICELNESASKVNYYINKIKEMAVENRQLKQRVIELERSTASYQDKTDNTCKQIELLNEKLEIFKQKYQLLLETKKHMEGI